MQRRKAWNGKTPKTEVAARRILLAATQECIERHGLSKVGLSDVASVAGVTRQTIYRYFATADELFNAAAVRASGGLLERMRARVLRHEGYAARIVEMLVVAIGEIPKDVHLARPVGRSIRDFLRPRAVLRARRDARVERWGPRFV